MRLLLFAIACLSLAAACAPPASHEAGPVFTTLPAALIRQTNVTPRYVYVADYANDAILVSRSGDPNGYPWYRITNGVHHPMDVFVDAHGTLYVLNSNPARITEYPHGWTSPRTEIPLDPYWKGYWIAVDSMGMIYVSAIPRVLAQTAILEYAPGQRLEPTRKIVLPLVNVYGWNQQQFALGLALDSSDNLYFVNGAECGPCGFSIAELPCGATSISQAVSFPGPWGQTPLGVAYDVNTHSLLVSESYPPQVDRYLLSKGDRSSHFQTPYGSDYLGFDRSTRWVYIGAQTDIYGPIRRRPPAIYDLHTGAYIGSVHGVDEATGIAADP